MFDEASEIDDVIWDVAEGAMTDDDTEILGLRLGIEHETQESLMTALGKIKADGIHERLTAVQ